MSSQVSESARLFDPYDYDFQEDPYPVYRWLRDEDPLHHNPESDLWVLSRHADIYAALRDDATYSNKMGVSIDPSAWGPFAWKATSFLGMDGKDQHRLRSLVSRVFTPKRVREMAPQIQRLTDLHLGRTLEKARDGETIDWIADFAGLLPMDVISEMLGVPEEERAEVRRLADLMVHRDDGVRYVPTAGIEAALTLFGYYEELVEKRRQNPQDDLTSDLLAAEIDGDRLTEDEVISFLSLMVVAGNETTTKLLGHSLYHLRRHDDQFQQVFDNQDDLVVPWIEETLRFDTSSQMIARYLLADVNLHGKTAPAGSQVMLCLGSANRDDRVFTDPDTYDIHRDKAQLAQSLSFGGGRHFCLGAHLARQEAQIALREIVKQIKDFEIVDEGVRRVHSVNVRGFAALPARLELR